LASALAVPGLARGAEPEPERFALGWMRATGAEACPSSPELGRLVEATVGTVLVPPTQATTLIDALVAPKPGGGFRTLIRVSSAAGEPLGERRLESDDARCSDVTRSTLLVLAVMINPEAAGRGLPRGVLDALEHWNDGEAAAKEEPRAQNPQPELPTEAAAKPAPNAVRPDAASPAPDERSRRAPRPARRFGGGAELSAALGLNAELTPAPSFGAVASLTLPLGDTWVGQLEAAFFPGGSAYIDSPYASDDITFTVLELAPELCPRPLELGRLRGSACAGAAFGLRILDDGGLGTPSRPAHPYAGLVASLALAWFFADSGFLDARVHASFLPRDDRFVFTDHDGTVRELFDPAPVAGYAAFGAGGVF
jgi:hypothetical protein